MKPEEVNQMIDQAVSGNWIPIGSIIFLVGVIVFLFIHILKMEKRTNDVRHKNHDARHEKFETLLEQVAQSNLNLDKIVAVHEKEIEHLKR